MTTSKSPVEVIRSQAIKIVEMLKKGGVETEHAEYIVFAVVMDDKTIKFTWTWKMIANTSSKDLIDKIMMQMQQDHTKERPMKPSQ